jgi:hypothetical protein
VQRRVETVNLAPRLLVVSIAFAAACGRTNLADLLVDPDATAGEGGSSQGGASNDAGAARGGISGAPSGGVPATGGSAGLTGNGGGGQNGTAGGGGQSGTAGSGGMTCGDGIVAPHEACDPGSQPVAPAFELRQGTFRTPVLPIVGVDPATVHYAYDSRSSHTGLEQPSKSILYLYRWNEEAAMSVIVLNGIDEDSTGLVQPPSNIVFDFAGLPDTAVIALSDDDIEFARITPSTARALWDCDRNSDGGVISGLSFPGTWHLTITPSFLAGITDWIFRHGTGSTAPNRWRSWRPLELRAVAPIAQCPAVATRSSTPERFATTATSSRGTAVSRAASISERSERLPRS